MIVGMILIFQQFYTFSYIIVKCVFPTHVVTRSGSISKSTSSLAASVNELV